MLSEDEMHAASFQTVVETTKQVVVGPLEWFGNGIILKTGPKCVLTSYPSVPHLSLIDQRTTIAVCHADPVAFPLSAAHNPVIEQMRGRERKRFRAQNPGNKTLLPSAVLAKVKTQIRAYNNARSTLASITNQLTAITEPIPKPPRRRRQHADAKLIAESGALPPDVHVDDPQLSVPAAASAPARSATSTSVAASAVEVDIPSAVAEEEEDAFQPAIPIPDHPVYASSGRLVKGDDDVEDGDGSGTDQEDDDVDACDLLSDGAEDAAQDGALSDSASEYDYSDSHSSSAGEESDATWDDWETDDGADEYSGVSGSEDDFPPPQKRVRTRY